ncbi:MAG: ATP-dependent sacrificial sulfur transferase LarE [Pseudomonadota bacterium]
MNALTLTDGLPPTLQAKATSLCQLIENSGTAVVAFSGGIDSSLVAYLCGQLLGKRAIAVTSGSASLKRSDLALSEALANSWGLEHRVITTSELARPEYRANPANRCYYCKDTLFTALTELARQLDIDTIFSGTNLDDLGDHRPGLIAAREHAVRAPLAEAGFSKADIRALARHLGLANAEKPQSACLASRFPYGTAIDARQLAQVEAAEAVLADLGLTQYRVRHHGDLARLEVELDALPLVMSHRSDIDQALKALGYRFVAVDLGGFQSGSLNRALRDEQQVRIQAVELYEPTSDQPPASHGEPGA